MINFNPLSSLYRSRPMINIRRGFFFTIIATSVVVIAFFSGYFVHAFVNQGENNYPILDEAYDILTTRGLYPAPSPPALEYGMIKGMLQAYDDPYTTFVEPVQHELESDNLQGSYGGIGIYLSRSQSGEIILTPYPGSPASRAGLLEGDTLIAVDDIQIKPSMDIDTILALIRGPKGEKVILKIIHPPDPVTKQFSIIRESISLPSVIWYKDPDQPLVGVIKVNIIAASSPEEILKAVADLQSRDNASIILDLRDNGGGLVDSGIEISRLFLSEGIIIQQKFIDEEVETYEVEKPGSLTEMPLAVLINHGTASAAEIIAGALKAHHRATLIGMPTFGKDTIQLVYDLEDGSSLHVTAARFWIPDLVPPLEGNGVQPDVTVEDTSSGSDTAISAAVKILMDDQ